MSIKDDDPEILRLNYELLKHRVEDLQRWKDAVDDALVVSFTLNETNANDPRKALDDLAAWTTMIALDPAISTSAAALIHRGRSEVLNETGRRRCHIPEHRKQIRLTQRMCERLRANTSEAWSRLRLVEKERDALRLEVYDLKNEVRALRRRWWFWR